MKFLAQGNTTTGVTSHSPINTAGSTGAMRVKFLAQGNNSKQHRLGIEPGSPGSQADSKPLGHCCLNSKLKATYTIPPCPNQILVLPKHLSALWMVFQIPGNSSSSHNVETP